MKERGILFSGPMARALLAGTKTQTRRAVRKQFVADATPAEVAATSPEGWQISGHSGLWWDDGGACIDDAVRCPYGMPGDRLWVREAWRVESVWDNLPPRDLPGRVSLHFEAQGRPKAHFCMGKLRPGMFMPRAASRITLEVTRVRVERLQDISEADALAEGVESWAEGACAGGNPTGLTAVGYYALLWNSINGPGSWDANPWVWVVEFRRLPSPTSTEGR